VEQAGIHQSEVSRQLRILEQSGFVSMRPDGQRRLYSLKREPFLNLDAWLGHYRGLWESRLDRFGAALEQRRAGRLLLSDVWSAGISAPSEKPLDERGVSTVRQMLFSLRHGTRLLRGHSRRKTPTASGRRDDSRPDLHLDARHYD